MSRELTTEQSEQQGEILKRLQAVLLELDAEYLEGALDQMETNHSFKQSAMILDPNPFSVIERGELEALKLKQLRYYLDARKTIDEIHVAEIKVLTAKQSENKLRNLFM